MVGGIIVTMIDRCAWFGRARPASEKLKKLQCLAIFPIPCNLADDHWTNHADPVCIPSPTTYLGLKFPAHWRRVSLLYPSPFHKLIPCFWIHQTWRPLTP
jgi:hypothetical protein